jgi:hypothetical protein
MHFHWSKNRFYHKNEEKQEITEARASTANWKFSDRSINKFQQEKHQTHPGMMSPSDSKFSDNRDASPPTNEYK